MHLFSFAKNAKIQPYICEPSVTWQKPEVNSAFVLHCLSFNFVCGSPYDTHILFSCVAAKDPPALLAFACRLCKSERSRCSVDLQPLGHAIMMGDASKSLARLKPDLSFNVGCFARLTICQHLAYSSTTIFCILQPFCVVYNSPSLVSVHVSRLF